MYGKAEENVTENVTENRIDQIIEILISDNTVTTDQLAKTLKVTKRTILRDIEKLRKVGKVKYIGPAKGGYWQVIKN